MTTVTDNEIHPLVVAMGADVERFNREIVGYPIPQAPQCLDESRKDFRVGHIDEELKEFVEATEANDLDGAADALIDLVYVALGALVEMGVCVRPTFAEVHEANMRKVQGARSKRPGSQGFDAVKPEGWTPPDHEWLLGVTATDVEEVKQKVRRRMVATFSKDAMDRVDATHPIEFGTVDRMLKLYDATEEAKSFSREQLLLKYGGVRKLEDLSPTAYAAVVNAVGRGCPDKASDPLAALTIDDMPLIFKQIVLLRKAKGSDYNTGIQLKDYFPFGHKSYAQMLHVKNLRVRSLLEVMDRGGSAKFEGLRDSVTDLINYGCYYVEAMDRGDFEPAEVQS